MSFVSSLHPGANVTVIGASGAIGGALVALLESDRHVSSVCALSRNGSGRFHVKRRSMHIDLTSEQSIEAAAVFASEKGPIDFVLVATGMLHAGEGIRPERSMRELAADSMAQVLSINTIGPALVAKHFLPRLRPGYKTVFAALSARVGSIGDNRLGGWTSYRASKAALNMVLKTLSIEQSRRWPESVVVALHPGTVDTELSRPFTRRLAKESLFSPETAASRLLKVTDNLQPRDTGGFYAWDGRPIPF